MVAKNPALLNGSGSTRRRREKVCTGYGNRIALSASGAWRVRQTLHCFTEIPDRRTKQGKADEEAFLRDGGYGITVLDAEQWRKHRS